MKKSLREFLENPSKNSDEFYNFYDWFCNDESLEKRMLSLVPKLKFLVKEGIINQDKVYVWFKNNCPMSGSLYDDMRISTLDDKTYLGGFCPRTGHNVENKCSVWTLDPYILYEFKNWNTFKKEVKTNKEFKEKLKQRFNV